MALKSLLARALAASKQAMRQDQQDGWSDGWHTQASMEESLRMLRDSATGAAKSTAQIATTPEGWRRIARGAGKVVGGAAMVAGGVAQGLGSVSSENGAPCLSAPWNANTDDPRTNHTLGLYYDHAGAPIDSLGNPLYDE